MGDFKKTVALTLSHQDFRKLNIGARSACQHPVSKQDDTGCFEGASQSGSLETASGRQSCVLKAHRGVVGGGPRGRRTRGSTRQGTQAPADATELGCRTRPMEGNELRSVSLLLQPPAAGSSEGCRLGGVCFLWPKAIASEGCSCDQLGDTCRTAQSPLRGGTRKRLRVTGDTHSGRASWRRDPEQPLGARQDSEKGLPPLQRGSRVCAHPSARCDCEACQEFLWKQEARAPRAPGCLRL